MFKYFAMLIIMFSFFSLSGCSKEENTEWEIVKEATCVKDGLKERYHDGELVSEAIPALGHDCKVISSVEATCIKEGETVEKCERCNAKFKTTLPKIDHDYEVKTFLATCYSGGYDLYSCKNCDFSIRKNNTEPNDHTFSRWYYEVEPTETSFGIAEQKCLFCDYVESFYVKFEGYIDMYSILEEYNPNKSYVFDSYETLLKKYCASVLSMSPKLKGRIDFEFGDFDELVYDLQNECDVLKYSYTVNYKKIGDTVSFEFSYCIPTLNDTTLLYEQYQSLNYQPITPTRSADYDGFAINESEYSYEVKETDQLVNVLERGVNPNCVPNSTADLIYNKMKQVLRQIISDDMSDLEKATAIHDYLIMNVSYDYELSRINGSKNKKYNGHYLEGVFLDQKAVCDGYAKAFAALCNMEGINCVVVYGESVRSSGGHAWNKVLIEDDWYIVDVTNDDCLINSSFEILTYNCFLIDEETYSELYTAENRTYLECEKNLDIYSYKKFTYKDKEYDFILSDEKEFEYILKYLYSGNIKPMTIMFKIDFDYEASITDEFRSAVQLCATNDDFLYDFDGEYFIIIRRYF